jgi:hypothetical protein
VGEVEAPCHALLGNSSEMGDLCTCAEATEVQVRILNTEVALQNAIIKDHISNTMEWTQRVVEDTAKEQAKINKRHL